MIALNGLMRPMAGPGLVAALLLTFAQPLSAQLPDDCEEGWVASPTIRSDAWTGSALRWLHDRGETADWPLAQRAVPIDVAGCLIRRATGGASATAMPDRWLARITGEVGPRTGDRRPDEQTLHIAAGGNMELERRSGVAAPGVGLAPPESTGARSLPDYTGPAGGIWGLGQMDRASALLHVERAADGGVRAREWDLVSQIGRFGVSVGRSGIGYGAGGLIYSGNARFDRVEVATAQPLRLSGFLEFLGPVAGHTFLAVLPDARHSGDPLLWGGSISIRPFPRLTLGLHRGMMFGGDGPEAPLTAGTLLHAFLGRHNNFRGEYVGDLRTQIVSVDVVYRLPLGDAWPVTAYLEWGTEDSAGALRDVPGIVGGLRTSPLIRGSAVTAGVERTFIGRGMQKGNPPWYRHSVFDGGWVAGDIPLGHPLGGHGQEWAGFLWADAPSAMTRVELRAYSRKRGALNLYAPGREGRSRGLDLAGTFSLRPGADVVLEVAREIGTGGWERLEGRIGFEATFR